MVRDATGEIGPLLGPNDLLKVITVCVRLILSLLPSGPILLIMYAVTNSCILAITNPNFLLEVKKLDLSHKYYSALSLN